MSLRILGLILLTTAFLLAASAHAQTVWYVDADATGANTGTSWADAFPDPQDALAAAEAEDEIWVAEGAYRPTSGNDRSASFVLPGGVRLFGGFAGTEAERHERDWTVHETVLSGDVGAPGPAGDNSYHVVTITNGLAGTTLDGFTIRDARADGAEAGNQHGAGVYVTGGRPRIANCRFVRNASLGIGSALYIDGASPHDVVNVAFMANDSDAGGAIAFTGGSRTTLSAATLTGNAGGGLVAQAFSFPQLNNLIIWDNGAAPSIDATDGAVVFVRHAIIEGGYTGTEVEDVDPRFVRPPFTEGPDDLGDLRLLDASPGHTLGDADFLPADTADDDGDGVTDETIPLDLLHQPRVQDAALTVGAFEEAVTDVPPPPDCPTGTVIHVRPEATPGGNGGTWATAFPDLQEGLARALQCNRTEVWVAKGTYVPGPVRDSSFVLFEDLRLLGGFDGTETSADQADPVANPTVLSGEIGSPTATDNVFTVLTATDVQDVLVDGFTVTRGYAGASGSGGLTLTGAEVTVSRSRFLDNHGGRAGAITAESNVYLALDGLAFLGNTATASSPGDVFARYTPVEVRGSTFRSSAHAIYHYENVLDIERTTFLRAEGANTGGGLSKSAGTLQVRESHFEGNRQGSAGAISADRAHVEVQNATFLDNEAATGVGGAISCIGRDGFVPNCTVMASSFVGNRAGYGGAVYCARAVCQVTRSSFEANAGTVSGGGLHFETPATSSHVTESTFIANEASRGGGLGFTTGNAINDDFLNVDVHFRDLTFERNVASTEGGGLWSFTCSSIPARLLNVAFSENVAARGGGLYTTGGHYANAPPSPSKSCLGETEVANARFVANVASEGAAVYVAEQHDATIGHGLTMTNATLAGNSAGQGGGVYNDGAYAAFRNGILWGNPGGEVAGANVSLSYAIVEGFSDPNPTVSAADPAFLRDPFTNGADDLGDVHLQDSSPAIDAGSRDLLPSDAFDLDGDGDTEEPLSLDLEGNPRLVHLVPDLGAFENLFGVATEPPGALPAAFRLHGAYPNPFNPATRLAFDLPESAEVEVAVFDVLGRRVAEVGPKPMAAGANRSIVLDGRGLASGLYVVRVRAAMHADVQFRTLTVTLLK